MRAISNPGLRHLLANWGARQGEKLCLLDLASFCRVSRKSLHLFSTGRKALPRVRRRVAEAFGLSEAQLLSRLRLPAPNPTEDRHVRNRPPGPSL